MPCVIKRALVRFKWPVRSRTNLLPLAMEAPCILSGVGARNHAATLRIALHEAYNCPEQTFGVDIVCLDMLGATIDR